MFTNKPTISNNGALSLENPVHVEPLKSNITNKVASQTGTKIEWSSNFNDMHINSTSAYISWMRIGNDNWYPVILEISQKSILIHEYSNQTKVVGTAYFRGSASALDLSSVLTINDKGSVSILWMPGTQQSSEASKSTSMRGSNILSQFTIDQLPNSVKMNVDIFENAIELTTSQFDSVLKLSGEFKTLLGSNRSTINIMRPGTDSLIKGGNKKSIKLIAKLDTSTGDKLISNVIMTGIRVWLCNSEKFSSSNAEGMISIKLFNREVKLKSSQKLFEIGFWDAEILYLNCVLKNELTVEFLTKDPVNCPINISGVDIFGKNK